MRLSTVLQYSHHSHQCTTMTAIVTSVRCNLRR